MLTRSKATIIKIAFLNKSQLAHKDQIKTRHGEVDDWRGGGGISGERKEEQKLKARKLKSNSVESAVTREEGRSEKK
jgi:hypothetical protein